MEPEPEERLQRLEAHVAHLEHLCDQLNGVVTEQSRELDRLRQAVQRIGRSVESMEMDRIKSNNPRPPHHG